MECKRSDGIQFILSLPRLRKPRAKWQYEGVNYFEKGHTFDLIKDSYIKPDDRLTTFNSYMVAMKSMDKSRDIKVTIIFIGNCTFEWNNKYIGAPLYIWINDNDKLQYVVICIFEKGQYVMSCYMELVNNKKE